MKTMIQYIVIMMHIISVLGFNSVYAAPVRQSYTYAVAGKSALKSNNIKSGNVEVQEEDYWARESIGQMTALSVMEGYGEHLVDASAPVTKVQALSLIYRVIGKEQKAQEVAALIKLYMQQTGRQVSDVDTWANGYLVLAMGDGLITSGQLDGALYSDQPVLDSTKQFVKTAPVQRQEIAEWMGKTLKLLPNDEQQLPIAETILDRSEIDPVKLPYVEMAIRENWIAEYNGFFYPEKSISWREMEQVIKNLEAIILERQGLMSRSGVIEDIKTDSEASKESSNNGTIITIKDGEGKLHKIFINQQGETVTGGEDTDQERQASKEKEIIILAKGKPVDSSYLRKGDKINYLVDENKQVRLIRAMDTTARTYGLDIAEVYKAHIYIYDPYEGELIVKDLKKWEQGKWKDIVDEQPYKSVAVDYDAVIYAEGKQINLAYINAYYTDYEIYFAVSSQNDKTGTAVLLGIMDAGSIQEIDGKLSVLREEDVSVIRGNNTTYKFSENTIIIKNNKVIQQNELEAGDKIRAVILPSEPSSELKAHIIQVYMDEDSKTAVEKQKNGKSGK